MEDGRSVGFGWGTGFHAQFSCYLTRVIQVFKYLSEPFRVLVCETEFMMSKWNSFKSAYYGAWRVVSLLRCLFLSFRNSFQKMGVRLELELGVLGGPCVGLPGLVLSLFPVPSLTLEALLGLLGLPRCAGDGEQGAQGEGQGLSLMRIPV